MKNRFFLFGIIFILMIITGLLLKRAGKPYPSLLFNVHKLISVGCLVFLLMTVLPLKSLNPGFSLNLVLLIAVILLFLGSFISGGAFSFMKLVPGYVSIVHKILPPVILIAGTWFLIRYYRIP